MPELHLGPIWAPTLDRVWSGGVDRVAVIDRPDVLDRLVRLCSERGAPAGSAR